MVQLAYNEFKTLKIDNILTGYYAINNTGAILNIQRGRILSPHKDKNGYYHIMLCTNEKLPNGNHKRVDFRVASLVMKTFNGLPPITMKDPTVDHIDGDIRNNHYKNLRWLERSENSSCRKNKGVGELNHEAILTETQVHEICRLLEDGVTSLKRIGELYGVSKYTISNIKRKKNWKHIVSNYNFTDTRNKGVGIIG